VLSGASTAASAIIALGQVQRMRECRLRIVHDSAPDGCLLQHREVGQLFELKVHKTHACAYISPARRSNTVSHDCFETTAHVLPDSLLKQAAHMKDMRRAYHSR
jgi:hypothetical protein